MERAACVGKDPEIFFPEKGQSHNPAKIICFSQCPVRAECDDYRNKTGSSHGIWAGLLNSEDDEDEDMVD